MFNESIKNSFTLTFDSCTTDGRTVNTALDYRIDIELSSDTSSPKDLIAAHQTETRTGVPKKADNIAVSDHLNVTFCFRENVDVRFQRVFLI